MLESYTLKETIGFANTLFFNCARSELLKTLIYEM